MQPITHTHTNTRSLHTRTHTHPLTNPRTCVRRSSSASSPPAPLLASPLACRACEGALLAPDLAPPATPLLALLVAAFTPPPPPLLLLLLLMLLLLLVFDLTLLINATSAGSARRSPLRNSIAGNTKSQTNQPDKIRAYDIDLTRRRRLKQQPRDESQQRALHTCRCLLAVAHVSSDVTPDSNAYDRSSAARVQASIVICVAPRQSRHHHNTHTPDAHR
jgi:hypothetical protein